MILDNRGLEPPQPMMRTSRTTIAVQSWNALFINWF